MIPQYKRAALRLFLSAVMITASFGLLKAETIFLRDGSIIGGTIVADAADSVSIREKNKGVRVVPRAAIMRILYTEIYLGKVYVQKIDGKNLIAYMVDEDRDTYTFRTELYVPEEFKLGRDQVLFMARGNPSGLEGETETDSVRLKWFAPYNPVKRYRIYMKASADREFKLIHETTGKNASIGDLKSNTKYLLYVTAIDNAGDESLPSNELSILTKNVSPTAPVTEAAVKLPDGGYRITWRESTDPDGKLAGYRVCKELKGKTSILTETKKREYTLSRDEAYDYIYITAIDDLKAESNRARFFMGKIPRISLHFVPTFLFPLGNLRDLAGYGYGGMLRFEMSHYFLVNLELAAETGAFYLPGSGRFPEPENRVKGLLLAPLMIGAGYAFSITERLDLVPSASCGMLFVRYDYTYFDILNSNTGNKTGSEVKPVLGAGLALRYEITRHVQARLSLDYRFFFEKSETFSFCTAGIGAGMLF